MFKFRMENNKATKETQKVCTERYITLKGITLKDNSQKTKQNKSQHFHRMDHWKYWVFPGKQGEIKYIIWKETDAEIVSYFCEVS